MKKEEIEKLGDDELFKLSLERGGKYNCYTRDALKAQAEYIRRKGNEIKSHNTGVLCKIDHSCYSDQLY